MLYESVLLFGILFAADYLFETLLQVLKKQDPALYGEAQTSWIFMVLGVYFIWCWIKGGQTLPMKTWHIRVVTKDGNPLTPWRAVGRYLLAWFMFIPGSAVWFLLAPTRTMAIVLPAVNFCIWIACALFDKDRQFPHDRLAGTRLIATR